MLDAQLEVAGIALVRAVDDEVDGIGCRFDPLVAQLLHAPSHLVEPVGEDLPGPGGVGGETAHDGPLAGGERHLGRRHEENRRRDQRNAEAASEGEVEGHGVLSPAGDPEDSSLDTLNG